MAMDEVTRTFRNEIAAALAKFDAAQIPTEIVVSSNLQGAINSAPDGSVLRLVAGTEFVGNFTVPKPLTLVTEDASLVTNSNSPALNVTGNDVRVVNVTVRSTFTNTNDLVTLRGSRALLQGMSITGNGSTKRGIAANGFDTIIDNCRVLGIGRVGQESQAIAMWDGSGLIVRRSVLQAGSTSFLSGGASPTVANHVPANLVFEDCLMTHDPALRGQGYVCKTGFELKSGRNVTVRNCTIENIWVEGQTGFAITLTPSNYSGNSPETTVEHVLFENNIIQNCGGGANIIGFSQHQSERPTQRAHDLNFVNNQFTISRLLYGGHGSLMQLGIEPANLNWESNQVVADGDAFIRTSDNRAITEFNFVGNSVNRAGTYGVWTPSGSRGTNWVTAFPGGIMTGNTFTGAHSTFRTNFPDNTYIV
jgi:hypothetical protein